MQHVHSTTISCSATRIDLHPPLPCAPPSPCAQYGVNLRPLLASLGASSLVVGIAAQSMLRNLAAGITLVGMGLGWIGWG